MTMKKIALGLTALCLIACNNAQKSGTTSDSDAAVVCDDLYQAILSEEYAKTETSENVGLGFYVYNLEDENSRNFTLYEASEIEQHWGIGGTLIPVEGSNNKYFFEAQDNFNGLPEVYNGTVEFTLLSNGEIGISFANTDGKADDFFSYFPHQLNFHKMSDEELKARLFSTLSDPNGWNCMDNDEFYVTFNLNDPNDLGAASYSTLSKMDTHTFTAIKSVDLKKRAVVMESVCGREGEGTKVDIEFSLVEYEENYTVLRFKTIDIHRDDDSNHDCYLINADFTMTPEDGSEGYEE